MPPTKFVVTFSPCPQPHLPTAWGWAKVNSAPNQTKAAPGGQVPDRWGIGQSPSGAWKAWLHSPPRCSSFSPPGPSPPCPWPLSPSPSCPLRYSPDGPLKHCSFAQYSSCFSQWLSHLFVPCLLKKVATNISHLHSTIQLMTSFWASPPGERQALQGGSLLLWRWGKVMPKVTEQKGRTDTKPSVPQTSPTHCLSAMGTRPRVGDVSYTQ